MSEGGRSGDLGDSELWEATTLHQVNVCPTCGAENDAATHVSGEHVRPEDGDVSICAVCAAVMVFTHDPSAVNGIGVRAPTPEEDAMFSVHPELLRVRAMITMYQGGIGS